MIDNTIEVDGHKLLMDITKSANYTLQYEQFELSLFRKMINEGDTVVDIGAHIGCYTIIAAGLVGEKGRVFAFEPDPRTFSVLKQNIANNGYQNTTIEQKAVSNENEKTRLYLCHGSTTDNRIIDWGDGWTSIEVETIRLDDYFHNNEMLDVIKMDIQGAEPSAIEGMRHLLKRNRNIKLYSEFWPYALEKAGVKPEEYIDMLTGLGFNLWFIEEGKGILSPVIRDNVIGLSKQRNWYTNILARRE